jgi:hypothetical protein
VKEGAAGVAEDVHEFQPSTLADQRLQRRWKRGFPRFHRNSESLFTDSS